MRERRNAEFSGKNVEEAISRGLSELNLNREEVEIHIITPGSRGVLGIGAEEARVSLSYYEDIDGEGGPAAPAEARELETLPASGWVGSRPGPAVSAEEPVIDLSPAEKERLAQVEQLAAGVVQQLLSKMGIKAQVVPLPPQGLMAEQAGEGRAIVLDIRGSDLGVLIGRRGETLAALQYIARLIVSRETWQWANIVLDVEQYRIRREQSLRQLALRMAERVSSTGQPVPLEAMTPYDRRVIHLTLHNHKSVSTKSVGEGDNRKVVIIPKE